MDTVGEGAGVAGVPTLLCRVLKNFQTSALTSLCGPGAPLVGLQPDDMEQYRKACLQANHAKNQKKEKEFMIVDPFLAPPPYPIQQMPVFTPVDTGRAERSDTYLEGATIACFYVGGELRLCLPQILNTVLREFTLQQINTVCDELHIFCSRCNPEQLETLKATRVLPYNAPSCGLITKTDAERLCNALLHRAPEKSVEPPSPNCLKVYHECFGKCKGLLNPDLYTSPKANCIQCADCEGIFSPAKFVCHSHKSLENKTCHWGFDSANWRHYLLLAKEQERRDRAQDILDSVKARFDSSSKYKRKPSPECDAAESKRARLPEVPSPAAPSWGEGIPGQRVLSAFQPWSPNVLASIKDPKLIPAPPAIMREGFPGIRPSYLKTGPPVLQNPERVIPYSESERYERHFTPNVALAPVSDQKKEGEEEEETAMEQDIKPSGLLKVVEASSSKQSPPREYREYDLPTDTDSSSYGQPSPDTLCDSPRPESMLSAEMEMVKQAVERQVPDTEEAKKRFMREFISLRCRHDEFLASAITARNRFREELASTKGRLRDMSEKKKALARQLERVRIEGECRLQEAQDSRAKILEELRALSSGREMFELQARLQHFESMYREVQEENVALRAALEERGVKVGEVIGSQKALVNGSPSPRAVLPSPSRQGDVAGPSRLAKALLPKKEWEPTSKGD